MGKISRKNLIVKGKLPLDLFPHTWFKISTVVEGMLTNEFACHYFSVSPYEYQRMNPFILTFVVFSSTYYCTPFKMIKLFFLFFIFPCDALYCRCCVEDAFREEELPPQQKVKKGGGLGVRY